MNSVALELRLTVHFQTMNITNYFIGFMHFYFSQNPYLNHFMKVIQHFFEHKQHSSLTDKNMLISFLE